MIEFYFLTSIQLGFYFFIAFILFVLLSIYLAMRTFHYNTKWKREFFGECILLFYSALLTMMPISVYGYRPYGVVYVDLLEQLLLIIGIIIIVIFTTLIKPTIKQRTVIISSVLITQPLLATNLNIPYPILWGIGVLLFISYSCIRIIQEQMRQQFELSTASIQEGLDYLPTGILFCGLDGYIYLTNVKMQEIMVQFMGAELKNGTHLWNRLLESDIINGMCQLIEDDILVCTEQEAWHFARRCFHVNSIEYVEITAIDATESTMALRVLERERDILAEETKETAKLAETMEAVKKEREYLRIRSQVHDVLGQQLTAMQRLSKSDNLLEYNELLTRSRDVIVQIKEQNFKNAQLFYEEISEYFQKIGLEVSLIPSLPEDSGISFLILSILREACTNAVRHAEATRIITTIRQDSDFYHIEIKNNGKLPNHGLVEGGGLFGIRTRVEDAGGTLRVEVMPEFTLVICLSKTNIHH